MYYFDSSDVLAPVEMNVAGQQLALAGLSYHPGVAPGGDPLDHVHIVDSENVLPRADLGILILHAAIEGHAFPGEKETFVRRSSLVRLEGFQIVLAGHVHAYDRFSIGDKAVIVCGATERMEFGQSEDKTGFVYLELTRDGLLHTEHIPIDPQPRSVVTIRTTELWPLQRPKTETELNPFPEKEKEAPVLSATEHIIQKIDPYCTEEAMVRFNVEGPITREQYHALDVRGIWLYGQQRAFSFELDESRLSLVSDLTEAQVERGERVAPREMLESIAQEWMKEIETPDRRAVLSKTRQRVLDRYDELSGREADQ